MSAQESGGAATASTAINIETGININTNSKNDTTTVENKTQAADELGSKTTNPKFDTGSILAGGDTNASKKEPTPKSGTTKNNVKDRPRETVTSENAEPSKNDATAHKLSAPLDAHAVNTKSSDKKDIAEAAKSGGKQSGQQQHHDPTSNSDQQHNQDQNQQQMDPQQNNNTTGKTTKAPARKRKPRSASNDSTALTSSRSKKTAVTAPENINAPVTATTTATASPPKRSRKKKADTAKMSDTNNNNGSSLPQPTAAGPTNHPQLLSVVGSGGMPMQSNSTMNNHPLPNQTPATHLPSAAIANRPTTGPTPLDTQHHTPQDPTSRYFSLTISPFSNYDYTNAASLTRPSLGRLWASSSSSSAVPELPPPSIPYTTAANTPHSKQPLPADNLINAFDDLRDNTWSHLSECILEQAQQFDIPSLIGTLYTLRSENEKLVNKVRDLTMKRDQLIGINARLDLPGPMLTQHLGHTSPNFTSVVAGLTNSPKSLQTSSPSQAMNKSPLVPGGAYGNHGLTSHGPPQPPGSSLGAANFIERNSPLVGAPHPAGGINSLKSSIISTPSPPTGALLAHGASNRASPMTINNSSYISNLHPSMSAMNPLGSNPPSSSFYTRQ